MKRWFLLLMVLPLAACSLSPLNQTKKVTKANVTIQLPDLGEAPELKNEVWLNTDVPLHLADLKGKVVLIDMWTFG